MTALFQRIQLPHLIEQVAELAESFACNASNLDQIGALPAAELDQLAAAGLMSAPLQPALGGMGLGFEARSTDSLLLILKHLGRGNLSVGRIYEGHVNALQLIQTFGTADQQAVYAKETRRGKIFGVWNAEAEDGVRVIPTAFGCRLDGAKTFCSGSGRVDRPIVGGALPDGQMQLCVVPLEQVRTVSNPDWWQPSGMRATASHKISFSGVELPAAAMLGQPGEYLQQPWLSGGVVRFAAVQLGGAEALLDATRQYLQDLDRIDHPHQQARVAEMAIALESGHLWLRGAASAIAAYHPVFGGLPGTCSPEQVNRLVAYANMTRTAIEQICMQVMQLCERCVGTRGLMPPHPMERIIRDLSLYLRQPAFDVARTQPGEYVLSQTLPTYKMWMVKHD